MYITGHLHQTPLSLQKLVRHTGVLHETVVLLTVLVEPVPTTTAAERIELTQLAAGFYRIVLHYGFMQTPNVPSALRECAALGLTLPIDQLHYIVGAVDLLAGRKKRGMALWRDKLFAFMARNTQDVSGTYQLPVDQLMSVGQRLGI